MSERRMDAPERPRRTVDEIAAELERIAFEGGEDAARLRALKLLRDDRGGATGFVLDPPLSEAEIIDRLARLLKPAGPALVQVAWQRAFPRHKQSVDHVPTLTTNQLPQHIRDEAAKILSLRHLYRTYPALKRPGMPSTYPQRRSAAVQRAWCVRQAEKYLLDVEQAKLDTGATLPSEMAAASPLEGVTDDPAPEAA
jgi:hypothetical protein